MTVDIEHVDSAAAGGVACGGFNGHGSAGTCRMAESELIVGIVDRQGKRGSVMFEVFARIDNVPSCRSLIDPRFFKRDTVGGSFGSVAVEKTHKVVVSVVAQHSLAVRPGGVVVVVSSAPDLRRTGENGDFHTSVVTRTGSVGERCRTAEVGNKTG